MSILVRHDMDDGRVARALRVLYASRKNEFKEIAEAVMRTDPAASGIKDWEHFVLNFCMDVGSQFGAWSGRDRLLPNSDLKALTLMRQLAWGKTSMNQVTRQLNTAYYLAEEFKAIYGRTE